MKTRSKRIIHSKTRKQKGGGVLSKPIPNPTNLNLKAFLYLNTSSKKNVSLLQQRLKYADEDLEVLEKNIAKNEAQIESLTKGSSNRSGKWMGPGLLQKKLQEKKEQFSRKKQDRNAIQAKLNAYLGGITLNRTIPHKEFPMPKFGAIGVDEQPIRFAEFVVSPDIGQYSLFGGPVGIQYTFFQKSLMRQILQLRKEAFPEEYESKNNDFEIWEAPIHCEAKSKAESIKNIMFVLYIEKQESNENKRYYERYKVPREIQPILLSSCSISICTLPSGLRIAELVGVATFEKYQRKALGTKLLFTVFNLLSSAYAGSQRDANKMRVTVKGGEVFTSSPKDIDYIWLYYDRTKPHLGEFYKSFGFKELTAADTDPELKEIYIGQDFLFKLALKNKYEKFFEDARKERRKITYQELEFVNEEDYNRWADKKREYLYNTWGQFKNRNGTPMKDNYTGKTAADFPTTEDYKQAIFEGWVKLKPNHPIIITQELREELKTLTEEEKYKALKFERENVQMVLSMADWIHTINKSLGLM